MVSSGEALMVTAANGSPTSMDLLAYMRARLSSVS
jgi:hypothetical protein